MLLMQQMVFKEELNINIMDKDGELSVMTISQLLQPMSYANLLIHSTGQQISQIKDHFQDKDILKSTMMLYLLFLTIFNAMEEKPP